MIACFLACVTRACCVIINHVKVYPVLSENNEFKSKFMGMAAIFQFCIYYLWEWDLVSTLVMQGCWSYYALGVRGNDISSEE